MRTLKKKGQLSVALIDSNQLLGEGLKLLLNELNVKIIFLPYPSDSVNLSKVVTEHTPDIIMMDVYQHKDSWATDLQAFTSEFPTAKLIIYSMADEKEKIIEAFKYGAAGYLSKRTEVAMLEEALNAVNQGHYYICPWFTPVILKEFRELSKRFHHTRTYSISFVEPPEELFTKRELSLIPLIVHGMSNKVIAEKLGLSEKTIKNHISKLLTKLELKDRTQIALTAIKNGWVKL